MRIFLLIAATLFCTSINAVVTERPSPKYPNLAFKGYSWMTDYKKASFDVSVSDDAKGFMSKESLKRYFKLKMRNFVKEIELVDDPKGVDHNYLYVKLELSKYNDKTGIYYGLVSLKLESAIAFKGSDERIYELTTSIAGSESQLIGFVKQEIDQMVEIYAEDYYYLDDLHTKHNKVN